MAKLKKYLAVYLGSSTGAAAKLWESLDEKARNEREKAGINGWMKWAQDRQNSIVDMGSPLGSTKKINAKGISDISNEMTGYTIIEAESHEAAAKLFLNHPHFTIFPGDSVEVMECLPLPEMP